MEQIDSHNLKRTKIVCTIGPATESEDQLRRLIEAGMDVARLNLSHGDHAHHAEVVKRIRKHSESANRPIGILLDLQGPKLRLGQLLEGYADLAEGETVTLSHSAEEVTLPIQFDLASHLRPRDAIFIDDGNIELRTVSISGSVITAEVVTGGRVYSNKGINVPDTIIPQTALTAKDRQDVDFGLAQGVDYFALSFVQQPEDIAVLRRIIEKHDSKAKIIAKIERKEAVRNIREITEDSDGLMVARGDLALEIGLEDVPIVQRDVIQLGRRYKKPVIIATQMLESMVEHPRPTRAEVNDVANAVISSADAVMLSAETAVGKHPITVVQTMRRIATRMERHHFTPTAEEDLGQVSSKSRSTDAVALAAAVLAQQLEAKLLVIGTASGYTALAVSATRPNNPVLAVTHDPIVYRQLALVWGIHAYLAPKTETIDEFFTEALRQVQDQGYVDPGDKMVIASGVQPGVIGGTNIIKIHTVGQGKKG